MTAPGGGQRFRLVHDVPLNASRADVRVHVMEYGESGQDTVQPCSWVTHWRGSKRTRSGCENLSLAITSVSCVSYGHGNPDGIITRHLGANPTRSAGLYSGA